LHVGTAGAGAIVTLGLQAPFVAIVSATQSEERGFSYLLIQNGHDVATTPLIFGPGRESPVGGSKGVSDIVVDHLIVLVPIFEDNVLHDFGFFPVFLLIEGFFF
jgi:hypothetical protein